MKVTYLDIEDYTDKGILGSHGRCWTEGCSNARNLKTTVPIDRSEFEWTPEPAREWRSLVYCDTHYAGRVT